MGTRLPSIASTPSEKAISVAIGMALPPQKIASHSRALRKSNTGTTMPPIAATMGSRACFREVNSPTSTSRLISRPIEKKKMAMSASLMNVMTAIGSPP